MAFENFNASFNSSDEEKKKEGGDSVNVVSPERFGGFNSTFDVKNPSRITNQTQQALPESSPVEDEGLFSKVLDTGKFVLKKGLDAWNRLQEGNNQTNLEWKNRYQKAVGKPEYKTPEEMTMDAPLIRFANSGTGKAVQSTVGGLTENWGIKAVAAFRAIGEETYDEAVKSLLEDSENKDNNLGEKFFYAVQNTPQSLLGMLISVGTALAVTRATGNAKAGWTTGTALSSFYYGTLSAKEQTDSTGKVYSQTNIGIDVVGDQIINNALLKIFAIPATTFSATILKTAGIEGTTENLQTLLKYSTDYGNATTDEEKSKILSEANRYVASGAILTEFIGGAFAGGIGGAISYNQAGKVDTKANEISKRIATSEAMPIDKAIQAGDVERSAVYQGEGDVLTEKFAQGRIDDVAQKLAMYDKSLEKVYRDKVDAKNTTMKQVVEIGQSVLAEASSAKKVSVNSNYIPNKDKGEDDKQERWRDSELQLDGEAIAEYRTELATLEESGDVTSQRYRDLQDFFTDYSSAFYDRTAYVPSLKQGSPEVEVVTIPFPDGKVAVRYGANTPFNSLNVGYKYGKLYDTKEEATQAALTDIQNWATEQRESAQDAKQQASYDRILNSAKNPELEANTLIASEVEKQKKKNLLEKKKQQYQEREERLRGLGEESLSGTQKKQNAFERSSGHVVLGKRNDAEIVIGSFGVNEIESKTKAGQEDRAPVDELYDAVNKIKKVLRSGDRGFREGNTVAIAEMDDGTKRAIVLRKNSKGQEEVVNYFRLGKDASVFEKNLEKYGAPERTRTAIASLEPTSPNPLEDTGKKSVSRNATAVKTNESEVSRKDPKYQRINQIFKEEGGYTSNEEAEKVVWSYFSPNELNVKFVRRLTTDKGNGAWGMWWNEAITMVRHPHWSTPHHESAHAYMGMFMEKSERQGLFDAIRKEDGKEYSDREAEEAIADGFVAYVRNLKTFTGKLKDFFERIKQWIRESFPNTGMTAQPVTDLYRNIIDRVRPENFVETPRFRGSVSTDMVEVSLMYQDAKDFTIKFLSSPMLQGKERFKVQYIKDSLRSGKFPINEKEQRFVNEVIDAHFADKKEISVTEFAEAIETDMLPMRIAETSGWADYGIEEERVGVDFVNEASEATTYLVGAGEEILPFMNYQKKAHSFEKEVEGFMFHFRAVKTDEPRVGAEFNVVEIQSDPFQKDLFTDVEEARKELGKKQLKLPAGSVNDTVSKIIDGGNPDIVALAVKQTEKITEAYEEIPRHEANISKLKEDIKKVRAVLEKLKVGELKPSNKNIESPNAEEILDSHLRQGIHKKYTLASDISKDWWGFRTGAFGYKDGNVPHTQEELADIMENGLISEPWERASKEYQESHPDQRFDIEPFIPYLQRQLEIAQVSLLEKERTIEGVTSILEGYANGEITLEEQRQINAFKKFMAYKDNWYELAVRVIIHTAARKGYTRVRFPSAFTVTRVEGWDSQSLNDGGGDFDEEDVRRADIGDTIDIYGEPVYVLEKYGDGSFRGVREAPDASGSLDDVYDGEREYVTDEWRDLLEDEITTALDSDRRGEVDTLLAYIGAENDVTEKAIAQQKGRIQMLQERIANADVEGAPLNGEMYINGERVATLSRDDFFREFNPSGNWGTLGVSLSSQYGGIFDGMTRTPETSHSDLLLNLLNYEMRRASAQDMVYIAKLILAGGEEEQNKMIATMDAGEIQMELIRFHMEGGTKETAEKRLAEYGDAVGADSVRSMVGSRDGDGVMDTFYAVVIKNGRPDTDGNVFARGKKMVKVPFAVQLYKEKEAGNLERAQQVITSYEDTIKRRNERGEVYKSWLEKEQELKTIKAVYRNGKYVSAYPLETDDSTIFGAWGSKGVEIKTEEYKGSPYAYDTWAKKPVFASMDKEKVMEFVAENPDKYEYREGEEPSEDYAVSSGDILDSLDTNLASERLFVERFIDARMEDFNAKEYLEDSYKEVYTDGDSYVAYYKETDWENFSPSDYSDSSEELESIRENFENETDLTKKNGWFGTLKDEYQGAAYRYEVDIPRYLKKYRKENVEDETKLGLTWTTYEISEEDNGGTPLYQEIPVAVDGKVRQSRAYQRVFARLTQATENDANYNQMSIAKDTASALAFVKQDPEGASKVALGVLPPPDGVTETAISIAVAEQAASQDNFELQAEVERSRSLRQTRRGQEIVAEKGRFNQNSPSHFIAQVLDARLEHLRSSYPRFALRGSAKKDASAIIDAETTTLRKKMKKQQEKTQLAQQVIDLLTC